MIFEAKRVTRICVALTNNGSVKATNGLQCCFWYGSQS
jgi:hypothetical protein